MLCRDNWLDISWDGNAIRSQKENIKVNILKKCDAVIPFQAACDAVALDIASRYDNLFVMLSGGCDSENVANAFWRNKIPFTPLMITYDHVQNRDQHYEQWYAKRWCKLHDVKPLEINVSHYIESQEEHRIYTKVKPRMPRGLTTSYIVLDLAEKYKANLISGFQLEYYPDLDQMTYLEPQLGDYQGFVMEETDFYIETMSPNRHPWAFNYWCPEIMASFVQAWDTNLNMQENKAMVYNVDIRPKIYYPVDIYTKKTWQWRERFAQRWGTIDCALMGTQSDLLKKLVINDN